MSACDRRSTTGSATPVATRTSDHGLPPSLCRSPRRRPERRHRTTIAPTVQRTHSGTSAASAPCRLAGLVRPFTRLACRAIDHDGVIRGAASAVIASRKPHGVGSSISNRRSIRRASVVATTWVLTALIAACVETTIGLRLSKRGRPRPTRPQRRLRQRPPARPTRSQRRSHQRVPSRPMARSRAFLHRMQLRGTRAVRRAGFAESPPALGRRDHRSRRREVCSACGTICRPDRCSREANSRTPMGDVTVAADSPRFHA